MHVLDPQSLERMTSEGTCGAAPATGCVGQGQTVRIGVQGLGDLRHKDGRILVRINLKSKLPLLGSHTYDLLSGKAPRTMLVGHTSTAVQRVEGASFAD